MQLSSMLACVIFSSKSPVPRIKRFAINYGGDDAVLSSGLPVAASAFLSGEAKGGQYIFRGQVYMVANNALPQCGTHIFPLFQVPLAFP